MDDLTSGGINISKITIKNVAQLSGVSISTVSRVLNNNQTVDPALAHKVLAAAQALNYRPSMATHTMRNGTANQIAFIVPTLEDSYYSTIASGIIDTARQNGQNVIVMLSNSSEAQETECFRAVSRACVDGIIFSCNDARNPLTSVPELRNVPMVIAARRQLIPGIPHVYSDNITAGYLATKYLLRLRRQKIALFENFWTGAIRDYDTFLKAYNSPARGAFTAFDRYTGYCQALEEEGLSVDPNLIVYGGFSHEDGYASAQALLASAHDFDAVLIPNDRCATGVLKLLNEQGLHVPNQISLICFNGGLMANVVNPSLTMIQQNNYELGVQAAVQLNNLIQKRPASDIKIDVNLVIKGSTSLSIQK